MSRSVQSNTKKHGNTTADKAVFVFVKTVTGGYSDFCKSQFRRKQVAQASHAADSQSVVCVCQL